MKHNIKSIANVKPLESSVEKAVEAALSAEQSGKVIDMTKAKKKFNFKALSAVAACLVAVIAGTAIFGNSNVENSFVIKANAATLSDDSAVIIGTVDETGGWFGEKENKDGSKEYSYTAEAAFTLNCEGENIKSVKYTGENCLFYISDYNNEGGFDGVKATAGDYNGLDDQPLDMIYKSYKTSYENQFDELTEKEFYLLAAVSTTDKNISTEAKQAVIDWNNHASYKLGEPVPKDYDDSEFDIQKAYETIFKQIFNNAKIKVEIEFNDGTKKTKTIKISVDNVHKHGGVELSAKIAK